MPTNEQPERIMVEQETLNTCEKNHFDQANKEWPVNDSEWHEYILKSSYDQLEKVLADLVGVIDTCNGHGTPIIKDRAQCYAALSAAETILGKKRDYDTKSRRSNVSRTERRS